MLLNKRMLLILSILFMVMIIPTAFAGDTNDTNAVGVNDDNTEDMMTISDVDVDKFTQDNSSGVLSDSEAEKKSVSEETLELNEDDGTIWVDSSVETSGTGIKSSPFKTIQEGLNAVDSDRTVINVVNGSYSINSQYTFTKSFTMIGHGDVYITSSQSDHVFTRDNKNSYDITFKGITFRNFKVDRGIYYYYYYTWENNRPAYFNFIECNFTNNKGKCLFYAMDNMNFSRCNFIGNTLTGSGNSNTAQGVIYNYNVMSVSQNIEYSNFVDNKFSSVIIYAREQLALTLNNNFWGTNDVKASSLSNKQVTFNNYVKLIGSTENPIVRSGEIANINLELISSDNSPLPSMPVFTVTLVPTVGNISPSSVLISNNKGKAVFNSTGLTQQGVSVDINGGSQKITSFDFSVYEKTVFVGHSGNGTGDGSYANPYESIDFALQNLNGNTTIMIIDNGDYPLLNAINDDVNIIGYANATIISPVAINSNVNLTNLTFKGQIVCDGTLNVYRCLFTGISAVNAITSGGEVNVAYSAFFENDLTGDVISSSSGIKEFNFWGTNDPPKDEEIENWVIVNANVEYCEDYFTDIEYDLYVNFTDNEGNELAESIPEVTLNLSTTLATIDSNVTISENKGVAKFMSAVYGEDQIDVGGLVTIDINILENEEGKAFVAPIDYPRDTTKPLGSKRNPYDSLKKAYSNSGNIIMLEGVYPIESIISTTSRSTVIAGRNATLTGDISNYIISLDSDYQPSLTLANLTFENITSSTSLFYLNSPVGNFIKFTLDNVTFANNKAKSLIYIDSGAEVKITNSNIINNTFKDHVFNTEYYPGHGNSRYIINYCNIIGNTLPNGKYFINDGGNANYNYWGVNAKSTNELPSVLSALTRNNWVILAPAVSSEILFTNNEYVLTTEFTLNDGSQLENAMPDLTFNIESELCKAGPFTISNNTANTTFLVTDGGNGTIDYYVGETKVHEFEIKTVKLPTEITVNTTSLELLAGDGAIILATLAPADAGNVTFTSSNESIVKVDDYGNVIALCKGQAIITVSFAGNRIYAAAENKTVTVNVSLNDANVTVDKNTSDLKVGETYAINATKHPDTILLTITYTSSNNAVVTVDENGIVTAVGEGTAIITVEVGDDKIYAINSTNVTVTVSKVPTKIAANSITATYNINKNLVVTLKDGTGDVISGVEVTVNLNGVKTYITDKNGQIKIPVAKLVPKTYTAKIGFGGNDKYLESSANVKVTVKKAKSKIVAKKKTFRKTKKVKKYVVTLKNNKNKPIKKVRVTLKIRGKKIIKAKTNNKGKAVFKIKKLTKRGTFKATIKFKGNKYYNKAIKKVKIKIK